jgi:hypothetical protein
MTNGAGQRAGFFPQVPAIRLMLCVAPLVSCCYEISPAGRNDRGEKGRNERRAMVGMTEGRKVEMKEEEWSK